VLLLGDEDQIIGVVELASFAMERYPTDISGGRATFPVKDCGCELTVW
jgi:hypothetical protein